jgi:hypothetical protein
LIRWPRTQAVGSFVPTRIPLSGQAVRFRVGSNDGAVSWYIPVALIVLAYPNAVIVFHAEPMEIGRHAVQMGVQLGVGFWMLLLFGMDIILVEALRRRTGKSEASPRQ